MDEGGVLVGRGKDINILWGKDINILWGKDINILWIWICRYDPQTMLYIICYANHRVHG